MKAIQPLSGSKWLTGGEEGRSERRTAPKATKTGQERTKMVRYVEMEMETGKSASSLFQSFRRLARRKSEIHCVSVRGIQTRSVVDKPPVRTLPRTVYKPRSQHDGHVYLPDEFNRDRWASESDPAS